MSSSPAFASVPNKGAPATLATGDTATDGTGANTVLIFTAGANGSFLPSLRVKPLTSNASASLLRVFRNNGSTPATAGNNALIAERALPIMTLANNAENAEIDVPLNVALQGGGSPERIYVCIGVTANWKVTPMNGGDF